MVIRDDVALGVHNETRSQRLANLAIVPAFLVRCLAAKEVVEKVLEVALTLTLALVAALVIVIAGVLGIWHRPRVWVPAALTLRLLRQRLCVDVYNRGTNLLCNLHKLIGSHAGVDHTQWRGIGTGVLLLLSTNAVCHERTGHNRDRNGSKHQKDCREPAHTQPFKKRAHEFRNLVGVTCLRQDDSLHQLSV